MDKSHIEVFNQYQLEDLGMTEVTKEIFEDFINSNELEKRPGFLFTSVYYFDKAGNKLAYKVEEGVFYEKTVYKLKL